MKGQQHLKANSLDVDRTSTHVLLLALCTSHTIPFMNDSSGYRKFVSLPHKARATLSQGSALNLSLHGASSQPGPFE